MPMVKENLLVTLADKNYIDQAKQLFSSVYWNAGWKGDYMLLAHEIPEKDLKWFRNKGILIKKCKPLYNKRISEREDPPVFLDKFYLFTSEFKKWKHVIYLDADIIVRASLDNLTKVKGFAAVRDELGYSNLKNQIIKGKRQEIQKKYNLRKKAFNSGVMAFSTDILQDIGLLGLNKLFRNYILSSKYAEQLFINLFLYKKWKCLNLRYNIWPFFIYVNYWPYVNTVKGIILHFVKVEECVDYRPWHPQNPFYKEWKYNLDQAELIDLNNIPKGKKWNEIKTNLCLTKFIIFLNKLIQLFSLVKWGLKKKIYAPTKKLSLCIIHAPSRFLGKFGIFLKKHNIELYNKLKNIEKKIRK